MEKVFDKNCLIYCRVSSPKQAQQGESFDDQEVVCRGVANRYNANVLKVYNESYSGRKSERPVIDEIISYIKKSDKKIHYLIFKSIDRFTRDGTFGYEFLKSKLGSIWNRYNRC
jgi:site-specific DNA recombinase